MLFKKAALGLGGALALGGLVFGGDLYSYLHTASSEVKSAVRESVPIEFEIKRARDLLTRIDPEIAKAKTMVARQDVEITALQKNLTDRQEQLNLHRSELVSRRDQLQSGETSFFVSQKKYSRDQLEEDLKTRLQRVKQMESTQDQETKLLARKETAAAANHKQLESMVAAKKTIELQIEDLEARLHTIRASEEVRHAGVDDSEFSRLRTLVADLDKELKVREKVAESDGTTDGLIPIASPDAPKSVLSEVDAYLGRKSVTGDVAATK